MIDVLLVDDHMLVRQGTREALRAAADIAIVAEAAQGAEALRLAHASRPDVVLLDIKLPDISGIDIARTLHEDLPDTKIVILTGYHYEQYVRALFAIGVQGYLLKSDPGLELIAAIRAVQRGEQVLSAEIARTLASRTLRSGVAATPTLSERERAVLTLLARGRRNKEIARTLGIETSTVETYISNAMIKLDVPTRIEAILAAIQRGAIAPDE